MGQGFRLPVSVSPQACICGAVILLTIPVKWVTAWIVAALCHECFHCLALFFTGKKINRVCIGAFGTQIYTDSLQPVEAIFCALAGPIAGLLLLLPARIFPRLAICGLLHSAFNLLPIYPLDGGIVLDGILRCFFSEARAGKVRIFVEIAIVCLLFLLCLVSILVWKLGIVPTIFTVLLLLRMKKRKRPCKCTFYRVQ